jgi:hypothetical protein
MAKALRKPQEEETRSYTERIRELIEQDCVQGARKLLAEALARGEQEPDFPILQSVLAPAKILRVGGERGVDRAPDFQWLKDHSSEYRGQWVALFAGELLAHGKSLEDVTAQLEAHPSENRALLHRIH